MFHLLILINAKEYPAKNNDNYRVKVYPDDGGKIAIVSPTDSAQHYVDAILFHLGAPINHDNAVKYLDSQNKKKGE